MNKKASFFKEENDRNYTSMIDEYRRVFQAGIELTFETKNKAELFDSALSFFLKDIKSQVSKDKMFVGFEFTIGDKKAIVEDFIDQEYVAIKQFDKDDNHAVYSLKIVKPLFSSKKLILEYTEMYKAQKSFYGLGDHVHKKLLANRCLYRGALMSNSVNESLKLPLDKKAEKIIAKYKSIGALTTK